MDMKVGETKLMKLFRYLIYGLIGLYVGLTAAKADSVAVVMENDTMALPKKDSEYTHGTEFTYMRDKPLWKFDNWGVQLQQNMYGPKLIKTDELQVGEHPYCGYLSLNFIGEQWFDLDWSDVSVQHKLGIGCVGPHSYAKESQTIIHDLLGVKRPLGWDKWQIKDEPIVQYEGWANVNIELFKVGAFKTYIIPRAGLDVGGFKDMIATGIDLKLGFNPPKSIGHDLILSAPKNPRQKENFDYSFFLKGGVEGRCVVHDTSIDGGLFRKSVYTNESEPIVSEFHFGGGLKIKNFEVEYTVVKRTNEFKTETRRPSYGRILLRWNF